MRGRLERKDRFVSGPQASQAMLGAAEEAFSSFPDDLCLTLTLDHGKENSCHSDLEKLLGFKIYFEDPGCAE